MAKQTPLQKLVSNINKINIAEELDGDKLSIIGAKVFDKFNEDLDSRRDWEESMETASKLVRQVKDNRTYNGEKIADIKYPIIATAVIQYAARALPAIIKDGEIAKAKIIGRDPKGEKAARGMRVTTHLNYQILEQMDGWKADMDQLLFRHAVLGSDFKKVYYDPIDGKNKSELVSPLELVVNYWAKDANKDTSTHIIEYTHNRYLENVNAGVFLDIGIKRPEDERGDASIIYHTFLEQYAWFDLDDDDYAEPYIITIHKETKKVVRIVARYTEKDIKSTANGDIIKINPRKYWVEYPFMPSFDGSFYKTGFGALISPTNEAVNTLMNQLIDAGTRANRSCGFIGKNIRMLRGGESGVITFKSDEWKQVQAMGAELKNSIVPLPSNPPSQVLFSLLGMLLEASKELSSRTDLLAGNQTQANVPATSTLALIEQGLKVFVGIYMRTFEAQKQELKMLFELNRDFLDEDEYLAIVDDPQASIADYETSNMDIIPVSTTASITEMQKYIKAQAVREWYGTPGVNSEAIARYYFEALEIPDVDVFLTPPPQQPPQPDRIEIEKLRLKDMELRLMAEQIENERLRDFHKSIESRAKSIKALAQAESEEVGTQINQYMNELNTLTQRTEAINQHLEALKQIKEQKEAAEAARQQQGQQGQQGQQNQ